MLEITEILLQILTLCAKNKLDFALNKEGNSNFIEYQPKKQLIINIIDENDDEFQKVLYEKLEELKQLFK